MNNNNPEISSTIKEDIASLLFEAREKLIAADEEGGGSTVFTEVSNEYGPIAHRVFSALDLPNRKGELYHSKEAHRVLLDPMTVLNRFKDLEGKSVDDQEFWCHGDMIKTLCDYLDLRFCGGLDACA